MIENPTSDAKSGIVKKLLLVLSATALIMASFLVGLVVFLPQLVSTARFKDFLESRTSSAINRRVQIGELQWAWAEEVLINNISIKDDPTFSNKPILSTKSARIKIFFGEILSGRLHFDIAIDGLEAGLIRSKNGQTNVGMLLAQFKPADTKEKEQVPLDLKDLAFSVPFDIQGRVHLDNIFVRVEDHMHNKRLALQNAAVHVDIPSLYLEPAALQAYTDIAIDGQKIPDAHLNISVKNLFNPKGMLQITDADIDMEGTGPGAKFVFNSNLNKLTMNSRIEFDLAKLARILKPFMPPQISSTEIAGNLKFIFNGSGNPQESLAFNSTLKGQGLVILKGFLDDKTLGPLNFNINNRGTLDVLNGRLSIEQGALVLLGKSTAVWKGVVDNLYSTAPQADLQFGSIRFDIGELLEKSSGFIPEGIILSKADAQNFPILEIVNVGFSGPVWSGPSDVSISDLVLKMPDLHFIPNKFQKPLLSAKKVRFAIEDLRSTLKDFFPTQMSLTASLTTDSILVKGEKDINVKKLSIPNITVSSNQIHKSKNPLVGLTASFKVHEALTIEEISIPSVITVNKVQQALDAELEFPAGINVRLAIKDLKIKLPSLVIENSRYGPFKTNVKLNGSIGKIELLNTEPFDADIQGIKLNLSVDDILTADFEADAENMAAALLKTKGKVFIDMAPLSEKLIARFYDKIRLTGRTRLNWDIVGRLPHKREIAKLASLKINFKNDLGFVDRLNTSCRLKDVGVDLTVSKSNHLKIKSISTGSPLSYRFDNKTGKGKFDGKILIRGIDKVPFNIVADKHLRADIVVSGEHDYLESATFSQVAELKPANIKHTFDLSLSGMDRIFKRNLKMPLPLWLKHIGATARGTLNVSKETNLSGLGERLDFDGRVETGLELTLVPNENIKLKAWALSPAMNVKLGKLFSVKSLQTNLNLKKDYRIITEEKIKAEQSKIVPLSVRVLRVESGPVAGSSSVFAAEDTAVTKFTGALQNRFSAPHAIAFKSAYMGLGPLPLSIDHSVIDFDLNKGLPTSDYFKLELLGGTVIGSVAVLQKNNLFFLQTQLAFSGLNTGKIYPPANAKINDDSELSGQLWALIPLSSQTSTLLQEFQMDLNLSRIGTRSLERILYALDPSESNEAIVSQRQLLRLGSPRWINVSVKDGSLSMEGEVDAQGVPVAIPNLRRMHIANVAGLDNYAEYLAGLDPLIAVLKVCAASGIKISKDGKHLKFQTSKQKRKP
jgi:hypothetical protein